jgi:hypothetical protein
MLAAGSAERLTVRVSPRRVTLKLGEQCRFKASVRGTSDRDPQVRWELDSAESEAAGQISRSGLYTAPTVAQTPTLIRVRAVAGEDASDEALVQIPAVTVHVSPERLRMGLGRTFRFKARVEGAPDERVTWSVDGGEGRITGSGLFTAPHDGAASITVRATSVADPSKSATATVTLGDLRLSIRPLESTVRLGEGLGFEARVEGTAKTGVRWSVLEEKSGEISSSGHYRTPPVLRTPASVTVVATSVANPNERALARVKIPAVSVAVSPNGAPRARRRGSRKIGATVYNVVKISLPFDPLDALVSFPLFRGRSGKVYVPLGGAYQLSAVVRDAANTAVIWSVDGGEEDGVVTQDGLYQAPSRLATPRVVQVRATSVADPSKSAVALLHIPPIVVDASPPRVATRAGAAVQLHAEVQNSEETEILWSVEGGEKNGTVSDAGLYHPPARLATPASVTVRAASAADPSKSAEIEVQIPAISIRLRPESVTLSAGESHRFQAEVMGSDDHEVRWEIQPRRGRIGDDGLYIAPEEGRPGVVQVTAISAADPTKRATALVRIDPR